MQGQIPPDFCLLDEIARRENFAEDPDAGERDSDWEECSEGEPDDPMDEDYIDPEYTQDLEYQLDQPDHDQPIGPSFIQTDPWRPLSVLPTKPVEARSTKGMAGHRIDLDELPYQWAESLREFFFPLKTVSPLHPFESKLMET
jgi:hypothetical protein